MPPHPRARLYRNLLYAMAAWVDEREHEKLKAMPDLLAAGIGIAFSPAPKKGRRAPVKRRLG